MRDKSPVTEEEKEYPHAGENDKEEENDAHVSEEVVIHQQIDYFLWRRVVRSFSVDEFREEIGQEVEDSALEFSKVVKDRWWDGGFDGRVEKSNLNELNGLNSCIGPGEWDDVHYKDENDCKSGGGIGCRLLSLCRSVVLNLLNWKWLFRLLDWSSSFSRYDCCGIEDFDAELRRN